MKRIRPAAPRGPGRTAAGALLLAGVLALIAMPCEARILKTRSGEIRRPLDLTVGSGFEYETDGEESEYGFPFLVEYALARPLKLSVEPGGRWFGRRRAPRSPG